MKIFYVRGPAGEWLHALDPLLEWRASKVRSRWTMDPDEATAFDSRTYAEAVAENVRPLRRWKIQRIKE